MSRRWLVITGVWIVLYPVPPLPFAPILGYATAILLGPPYTVGTTTEGWPQVGAITPTFLLLTVGIPWFVTTLVVAAVGLIMSRRTRRTAPPRDGSGSSDTST